MKVFGLPIILLVLMPSVALAYDRNAAVNYALEWYDTDVSGDNKASHINNPNSWFVNHTSLPRPTSSYRWYNSFGPPNVGDDTIPESFAEDCANFVSAAMIAGGIIFPHPDPNSGGTVTLASRLACELAGNSEEGGIPFDSANAAPADLATGDVVIFHGLQNSNCQGNNYHAMIVVSGSGPSVVLAAHGTDHHTATLGGELNAGAFCHATAYHITSDNPSPACPIAAVTMSVTDPSGNPIADGAYTDASGVTVSGSGFAALDVMTGSPALNSDIDVVSGLASVLSQYGPASSYNPRNGSCPLV